MKREKIKTLIHTALVAEAKPIIGFLGLKWRAKIPLNLSKDYTPTNRCYQDYFNLYTGENIALISSGIGAQNTKNALFAALALFEPKVAINIGIAGCADPNIKKGSLFCATHKNLPIPYASLTSFNKPISMSDEPQTLLADQEGEAFLASVPESIERYIFKVVSDYLEPTVPTKGEVSALIQQSLHLWSVYAR